MDRVRSGSAWRFFALVARNALRALVRRLLCERFETMASMVAAKPFLRSPIATLFEDEDDFNESEGQRLHRTVAFALVHSLRRLVQVDLFGECSLYRWGDCLILHLAD